MAPRSMLPLVDRLVPGGIEKFLREARARGESTWTMRDRLLTEHEITVGPETLRKWCDQYEIEKAS